MTPMEQFERVCDDYSRWYAEGRWTFERFTQALKDAAAILFPLAARSREDSSPSIGTAA